ncbi:MAG: type II toxin-antitoxin system RelE/ParE family toxin [Ruminococcus sp.]|jgi:mRNA interferase RelE/StbE|nr:type II toxin-antitoxin system RelE/ParE family toxin [Ruminococcus sp.]
MLKWHKQAIKHMGNLPLHRQNQINQAISYLPYEGDIKKLKGSKGRFRLRVGDYRIIYRLTGNDIHIDDVTPRGSAYKY